MSLFKGNKIKLSYVLFIFCFIFAPPLIPKINLVLVLFLYSLLMILTKYNNQAMVVFRLSGLRLFTSLFFISMTYLSLIIYFGYLFDPVNFTNYITTAYRFFMIFPVMLICILFIILRTSELGYKFGDLLKSVIYAGLLQAGITGIMLLSSEIRSFLLQILYFNTGNELSQNLWHIQRRFYAFSHNVFDTFGYGTGIIAAIPLFYGIINNRYKYFVLSVILLVVPLFNSRTGLIIFFIGVICAIPFLVFQTKIKNLFKLTFILSTIYILSSFSFQYISDNFPNTINWAKNGIDDFVYFFKGNVGNDSVSIITSSEKWHLPEKYWILTGTGHNVYGASGYSHSDVGYVNDLWLVGLLGIFLLYLPFIFLVIMALKKTSSIKVKSFIVFLMTAFFVANVKTIVLNYNVGTSITLLFLFFIVYYNENDKLKKGINDC